MKPSTIDPQGIPTPAPRVGVVIVTWNKKDYVLQLLDDLAAHPYPNWTVLVVDSHSSDGTLEALAARHPWVNVLPLPDNLGGSGGFNAGLRAMLQEKDLDYVWLLDNDVSLEPGALETLVETLEARPDAGVAGSHMIQMDNDGVTNEIGGDVDLALGRLILHHHGSLARFHRDEIYDVDYVAACSLLVRFSVLRQVGLWDDFFIHYDDVDWCLRIRAAGHRILACAASRIRHMSARVKPVTWVLYYDIRNMLYLRRKHMVFRPLHELAFLLMLLYFAIRDEFSGKGYYSRLVQLAARDFVSRRMGKCTDLPALDLRPARPVLDHLLQSPKPSTLLVLEPTRKPLFTPAQLAAAAETGLRTEAVCRENDSTFTALPPDAHRMRLSSNRWTMAAQLLTRILFQRRADVLVLDVDRPCGLLGLCARRILLLVDDKCHEQPGGFVRILAALAVPFRWIPIFLRWVLTAPPIARIEAAARVRARVLRRWPWRLFPGIALRCRLHRWPLPKRIKIAQSQYGKSPDCVPPARPGRETEAQRPKFKASTAAELKTALLDAAYEGGDVLLTHPRIELEESLHIPSGVRLIGRHDHATLVFRNVPFGIVICGEPNAPVRNISIRHLTVLHESTSGGFSAALFIARAQDIVLDGLHINEPCAIGLLATHGAERVAMTDCSIREARQDGMLLLRRVVDFSADSCIISDNRQSGLLLCDWPLPPGLDPLDFDAQLRHRATHAIAFAPADPAPCRVFLSECTLSRNRKMGICTDGAGYLTVDRCQIHDNQCEGITLDNGTWHARISRCEITGNGHRGQQTETELRDDFVAGDTRLPDGSSSVKLPGISMDNAAFCRVEDCSIHDNYGEGVKFVRAAYRCTVQGNGIENNNLGHSPGHLHHGIRIGADPSQHKGQHDFPSSDNDILDNRITGPHENGILLNEGTARNRIKRNTISGQRGTPIQAWSCFANRIRP